MRQQLTTSTLILKSPAVNNCYEKSSLFVSNSILVVDNSLESAVKLLQRDMLPVETPIACIALGDIWMTPNISAWSI